ncbi:L-lactate permease [Terriglobus saanensis]|uniref:L-lactate permease n=1 Tax=Terriglobus saanensis TaxID=870903 RepID=UPI000304CCA6|nr:L-lactate permease [Terriglobus saanensis]
MVTASRLGFSSILMGAANSSGAVMGKMISLQTIAIAAGATRLTAGDQVKLFRFTLRHSICAYFRDGLSGSALRLCLPFEFAR